jgi:hypothetical protein
VSELGRAAWGAIESLHEALRHADERERWIYGALLSDGEGKILGKRVRLHVEWLDGLPGGMTEDEVREYGRRMLPDAERRPEYGETETGKES